MKIEENKKGINWLLRFKNKTVLTALLVALIAIVYKVCAMAGVVPPVSQSDVLELVDMLVYVLLILGVVVDPTTPGISDSPLALARKNLNDK